MEAKDIKRLKIAANQFYLGLYMDQPLMSDQEYDALARAYEEEYQSVKCLVDWPEQLELDNEPEEPLDKEIVEDNDLSSAIQLPHEGETWYLNYKFDGGGIKLVYNEVGHLQRIQSTPDEKMGIVRTEQFWNMVPHWIDPSLKIKTLRGEVLVDANVYGKKSRNKANGLINSTVNKDEIQSEGFIRIYKVTYFDENWSIERQLKSLHTLPRIMSVRTRYNSNFEYERFTDMIFGPAEDIKDRIPTDVFGEDHGLKVQCDGVVRYGDSIQGYKFYYSDSAVTTVKNVLWNEQSNGSYAAVLELEPIELDEKSISKASSNGVPKMIRDHCGKGAKVRVILANTTIPKVVEVLEPSDDFQFPKCECGYQMTEKDLYGSVLKCGAKHCSRKFELWLDDILTDLIGDQVFQGCDTIVDCINASPQWFGYLLHVDRWDAYEKTTVIDSTKYQMSAELRTCMLSDDPKIRCDLFERWVDNWFYFTDLQHWNKMANVGTAYDLFEHIYEMGTLENIRQYLLTK